MKRVLLIISTLLLINNISFAADETTDVNQILNTVSMPTDEEIKAAIEKFDFDKTQQEYLFKETKKKLEQMYTDKEYAAGLLQQAQSSLPEVTKSDISIDMPEPSVENPANK